MSGNLGNILKAAKAANDIPQPPMQEKPAKQEKAEPASQTVTKGKYRDEEYERLTVYVRKETKKAAARKWEDEGNRDVSELVQQLLSKYVGT